MSSIVDKISSEVMVSIICNVYNHAEYLRETLDGFVNQKTNFLFQVLVHDDASTDGSAQIIREYEEKYPDLIKPIYQTVNQYSRGGGISKRFQMPRTNTKYVALCEGDDYWTDMQKLQKQFDFMESNPEYTLCTCSTQWLNMLTGKVEHRACIDCDSDISLEDIILENNGRIFQLASFFLKTDIWKNHPAWRVGWPIGDLPLAILAALNGKVRMLADVMCVYRWYSKGSWTARMDGNQHRIKINTRLIGCMERLNEETEHKYDSLITLRIKRYKYGVALLESDLKRVRSKELREVYLERDFLHRLSDIFRCVMPRTYKIVQKIITHRDR